MSSNKLIDAERGTVDIDGLKQFRDALVELAATASSYKDAANDAALNGSNSLIQMVGSSLLYNMCAVTKGLDSAVKAANSMLERA